MKRLRLISMWLAVAAITLLPTIPFALSDYAAYSTSFDEGRELVPQKPAICATVHESTPVSQSGGVVGHVAPGVCFYEHRAEPLAGKAGVELYAWVWRQSLVHRNDNLRVASNRTIVGGMNRGARGHLIYENGKGSWALVHFTLLIDTAAVRSKGTLFGPSPIGTMTTSGGGDLPDDITPESAFLISVVLFAKHHRNALATVTAILLVILAFVSARPRLLRLAAQMSRKKVVRAKRK
jgi:hypothetical protein